MAKQSQPRPILLRWSDYVPASDVQDPLGLGLRGSARLASRLLFCITSITPRARYFSFIPWCIFDYQKREKDKPYALGLRDAIVLREKALTLGCVAHHDGEKCNGGALVGSTAASKWFAKGRQDADLKRLKFAKVPALNAYFNSLVNLGCFVTEEEVADSDEEIEDAEFTFDDIELSSLGRELAEGYDSLVGRLASVRNTSESRRRCSVKNLREWGKRGGLCELAEPSAPDRHLLRDIFLARTGLKGDSHQVRKQSLILIVELCRQLSAEGWSLGEPEFASAVYFGEIASEDGQHISIEWPDPLTDIATRWRMFYFHHFASVALEGMFAWLVTQLSEKGLAGATVAGLADGLTSTTVSRSLSELLEVDLPRNFGRLTPTRLFERFGIPEGQLNRQTSQLLDSAIRAASPVAEHWLEIAIRDRAYAQSPAGLAVPIVLLGLTLARYAQWENTNYGNWLARAANDPYLDLIPPVLATGLTRRFGEWWQCQWRDLAESVLSRYVVQQHLSMSYEKSAAGDRCLLQVDGNKVISSASYDKIGMGNPRLGSAIQVLKDLALLTDSDDGFTIVTDEGLKCVEAELA